MRRARVTEDRILRGEARCVMSVMGRMARLLPRLSSAETFASNAVAISLMQCDLRWILRLGQWRRVARASRRVALARITGGMCRRRGSARRSVRIARGDAYVTAEGAFRAHLPPSILHREEKNRIQLYHENDGDPECRERKPCRERSEVRL